MNNESVGWGRRYLKDTPDSTVPLPNHWKTFLDAAPDALFIVDPGGRIKYASTQAEHLFGYPIEEMLGSPVEMFMPQELHAEHERYRQKYVEDPTTRSMSRRSPLCARRKDGTEFPVHVSLNPIKLGDQTHILASVRDITELEQVRHSLELSETRLRSLLDHMPDAVAVHRNGVLIYVNSALVDYLGYDDPSELVGTTIMELLHPDDREVAAKRLEKMNQTGEKAPPVEERFFRRDGTTITAEIHVQPMTFEGESAFVVIGRDVSRKHEILARAMQLDRKFAVGTLATGVAHEINNPLSYAKANVEFVMQHLKQAARSTDAALDADALADMIDALSDSSSGLARIGGIVHDLETFVDHHGGGLAKLDVEEVLEASLNLVYRQLDSRAHVIRELRDPPSVQANRGQLAEVFINVLTNALLSFTCEDPEKNELRITTACVDDQVTITVSDTGCGISQEALASIFDPFFSTRDEGEGTGLGLTIALNTLEKFGGGIELDSTLGEGTTVKMWLPALEPEDISQMDEDTQPLSLSEDTVRDD